MVPLCRGWVLNQCIRYVLMQATHDGRKSSVRRSAAAIAHFGEFQWEKPHCVFSCCYMHLHHGIGYDSKCNNCGSRIRCSSSIPRLVKVGGIRTGLRFNFLRRLFLGSPHDADGQGDPCGTTACMITSDICTTDGHAIPGDPTADDRDAKMESSTGMPKAAIFTLIGDCRVRI